MSVAGDFRLRAVEPVDVKAMYRLDEACFEAPFRFDLDLMRRWSLHCDAIGVVAEIQGQIAGFVIVETSLRDRHGYVVTLDVADAYRRQGLARKLMAEAEGLARAKGFLTRMSLHVYVGNDAAITLYESAGYVRTGTARDFYEAGLDAFTYNKDL